MADAVGDGQAGTGPGLPRHRHREYVGRRRGDGCAAGGAWSRSPRTATSGRAAHRAGAGARPWWPSCAPSSRTVGCSGLASACPGRSTSDDGVPVSPPIMPGWDRYPGPGAARPRARLPGRRGQRREHHGDRGAARRRGQPVDNFLFVKIGTGIGCGIFVDGELYRGADGCAGDIGHIQVDATVRSAPAATSAAWRRSSAARPWPATPGRGPERDAPRAGRDARRRGTVTALEVAAGAAEGDAVSTACSRRRAAGRARCWPALVCFINPR